MGEFALGMRETAPSFVVERGVGSVRLMIPLIGIGVMRVADDRGGSAIGRDVDEKRRAAAGL